jgi:hypothetical protein
MERIGTAALLVAFAGALSLCPAGAQAQSASSGVRVAQATQPVAAETPRRVRPRTRLRVYPSYPTYPTGHDGVYPRYNPGPNAVRECSATYVREYRPSGTVIVPRMSCFWRPG